jgi:putative membrane protein
MHTFSTVTAAALLAAGAATLTVAQTPSQSPSSPSAASSPSQRQATGAAASEAPTTNGADPGTASTPSQHQTLENSSRADTAKAVNGAATPASFVSTAAQDGMTEVALGKLALHKSSNDDVKQFAQKMVEDHGAANSDLAAIAKAQGITVPTRLDAKHEAMVKEMSAKSGTAFDQAYAAHMAKAHTEAVALFEAASNSSDPELSLFARKTLPTLQQHEQLADNLRASVGARRASAQ